MNKIGIKIVWFESSNDFFQTIDYIVNNYNIQFSTIVNISKKDIDSRINDFYNGIEMWNTWSSFLDNLDYDYRNRNKICLDNLELFIDSLNPNSENINLVMWINWTKQADKKYFKFIKFQDLLYWKKVLPFQ